MPISILISTVRSTKFFSMEIKSVKNDNSFLYSLRFSFFLDLMQMSCMRLIARDLNTILVSGVIDGYNLHWLHLHLKYPKRWCETFNYRLPAGPRIENFRTAIMWPSSEVTRFGMERQVTLQKILTYSIYRRRNYYKCKSFLLG